MKLPQVTYGAVENIRQGSEAIGQAGVEHRQRLGLLDQVSKSYQEAYTARAASDTRNKMVEYRAQLKMLEDEQTDNANRNLDPQELRAYSIAVDDNAPVKGSLYAAPLFEKKAAALREGISKTIPDMFREKFDAMSEDAAFQAAGNVFNKSKQWKQDEDLADYASNNEQLRLAGLWEDSRAITRQAVKDGTISEQEAIKSIQQTDIEEAQAPALAAIADNDMGRLDKEIEKFRNPEYQGPLDAVARRSVVTSLEQRQAQIQREIDKAKAESQLQKFGDMEVGVVYAEGKNRLTLMHIDRAWKDEGVSTQQRNQLTMQYWARIRGEEKDHKQLIDVEDAVINGVKLSHADGDHKNGVDNYTVSRFGTSIDAQKGTPEQKAAFERGNAIVASTTGILSNEAKAYIVGMNRSEDPVKVVDVANFYSQLQQVAPQTLGDLPERDRIQLEVTSAMASAGVPAAMAAKYGREAADRPPEQQEIIKNTYADSIKASGDSNDTVLQEFLSSDNTMDPFFGSPAQGGSKLKTEHESLVWTFYGQTGDLGIARKMAQDRIRETWGRSEINGVPQAMKYAPEIRTGRKSSELRDELEAQIAAGKYTTISGSVGGAPVPVNPKKVIITSDTRTGKDNRYAIQVIREDGMIDNVYTLDGKQAYWNPIPDAKEAAEKRIAAALEDAKIKRKQIIQERKRSPLEMGP